MEMTGDARNMNTEPDTNKRTMMRLMLVGFGLVLFVLGLAIFVAARDSDLRADTSKLVQAHLGHAQLLSEVQSQENILSLLIYGLNSEPDAAKRDQYREDLAKSVHVVKNLAEQAAKTSQAKEWSELAAATQRFEELAKEMLEAEGSQESEGVKELQSHHASTVKLIHSLVQNNTKLWESADEQMQMEVNELANDSVLMMIGCFLLAIIFAASTVIVVRKGIQRIEWQRDELNRVSWHMLQTQEDTARRFSHEMHDELGQSLAAVRANLSDHKWMHEERRADSMQLVDEAIANVRELSQLLRPVILDDFGLEAALRSLADRFGQRTRMDVNFSSNLKGRIESHTETHLFRIAQEALTNIARHSQATSMEVNLTEEANQLCLIIQDNGIGMPAAHEETSISLGLIGMRARARECGGILKHEAAVPHGVKITVRVPRQKAQANRNKR